MPKSKTIFETATNTYTAQGLIGNGGVGTVYSVTDTNGNEFALKCLREATSIKRQRFRNELFFCQQEVHPNIVRVLDSGILADGKQRLPFYVMRRFTGTLRMLMDARLAPDQILPLFDQILSGVEAAHLRGVYHRDLKPENILYDAADNRPVVADFGIAHFGEDELLTAVETKNQERLGNFIYAAPEQKIRGSLVENRADIFALGLILNEMFTGTVPLAGGHPLIVSASASHSYLDEMVNRMILHSPASRYATVAQIKEELIGRRQHFVALQRLDAATRKIVPESAPDDPLNGQDVKIVGFDYEPGNQGQVIFNFNLAPPEAWKAALRSLKNVHTTAQVDPALVTFNGASAGLRIAGQSYILAAQLFKQWVATANVNYRTWLTNDADKKYRARVADLQKERERAEEKARATKALLELL